MEIKPTYSTIGVEMTDGSFFECVSVSQAADELCATPSNVNQWVRRITKDKETSLDHIMLFKSSTSDGTILIPKNKKYNLLLSKRALLRASKQIDNGEEVTALND